jgi:hypothetical protein
VNGQLHIDHCSVIGGRKIGNIWVTFNALVTWIAQEIKGIPDLLVYSDDSFRINPVDEWSLYAPYQKWLPTKQAHLLYLWNEIGLPHKEQKQVSGSPLPITGTEVDLNELTYTLSSEAQQDLIDEMMKFCR